MSAPTKQGTQDWNWDNLNSLADRAENLSLSPTSKEIEPIENQQTEPRRQSQFEYCFAQYPILESIAANLTSADLFRVAQTSKTNWYSHYRRDERAWKNLNSKAMCDGYGIQYRARDKGEDAIYSDAQMNYLVQPKLVCGSQDRSIKTRPCVLCHRAVCNECRTHVAYSVNLEVDMTHVANSYTTDVPLDNQPYRIVYSFPDKVGVAAGGPPGLAEFGHDKGTIGSTNEFGMHTPNDLHMSDPSYTGEDMQFHISREYRDFEHMDECLMCAHLGNKDHAERIRFVCKRCHETNESVMNELMKEAGISVSEGQKVGQFDCHCSLRSRWLDRWMCIPCFETEEAKEKTSDDKFGPQYIGDDRYWERICADPRGCSDGLDDCWILCSLCGGLTETQVEQHSPYHHMSAVPARFRSEDGRVSKAYIKNDWNDECTFFF